MGRLDTIKAVAVKNKNRRKRDKALHVSLTQAERDEFDAACAEHGLLEREMVMNAVRAYKSLTTRVDVLEAQMRLLITKEGS
jgi:hypothetical protein